MREVMLSPNQIEDAAGTIRQAADYSFSDSEQQTLYTPNQDQLPRPDFALAQAHLLADGHAREYGTGLDVTGSDLTQYPNLRVIVGVKSRDQRDIYLPGVVLRSPDGPTLLGALASDARPEVSADPLPDTQQLLLDQLFTLQNSSPADLGHDNRQVNTAEIAHLSLVAASREPQDIHHNVHQLADGGRFAQTFSSQGAQDLYIGDQPLSVKNVIIPASQAAAIYAFPYHQPVTEQFSDLQLTPVEMAAGLVLAAATSRGVTPDLPKNLTAVAEQTVRTPT